MKKTYNLFYLSLIFVLSCSVQPVDHSRAHAWRLLGAWEWEKGPAECREDGYIEFRPNGTYTLTSSSCHLEDDGFGHFHYGWYIAEQYICFVYDEREYEDEKQEESGSRKYFLEREKEGFQADRCPWRILSFSRNSFQIKSGEEVFALKKTRPLGAGF
jgi:hypothetical protein